MAVLRRSVALKAEVRHGGAFRQIDVEQVVPGDILKHVRMGASSSLGNMLSMAVASLTPPRPALAASSLVALAVAMALPFTAIGRWFGFEAPSALLLAGIGLVVVVYLVAAELLKVLAAKPRLRPPA